MSRWTEEDYLRHVQHLRHEMIKAEPVRKPLKYRNIRNAEGDSKKERDRYHELELLEKAGEIRNLRKQVDYALVVNGQHICNYRADFVYEEGQRTVVEDVKSPPTRKLQTYRIKKKLMKACHDIDIRET